MAGNSDNTARHWWHGAVAWYSIGLCALIALSSVQYIAEAAGKGRVVQLGPAFRGAFLFWFSWSAVIATVGSTSILHCLSRRQAIARRGWLVMLAILTAGVHIVLRSGLSRLLGWESERTMRELFLSHYLLNLAVATCVIAFMVALHGQRSAEKLGREAQTLRIHEAELESRLARTQLEVVRGQLEPHFLLNTLQGIAALVHSDPVRAESMLAKVGELLREVVVHSGRDEIPLDREIEFVRSYLALEQMRFADRLKFSISVEVALPAVCVPPFVLQPLVENAVRHGLSPRAKGGSVQVTAKHLDGTLLLIVEDDGVGISVNPILREHPGVGIATTRARLTSRYGVDYQLTIEPRTLGGTIARISIFNVLVTSLS